jgi:transglutaminase-like putative cysteine protease
MNQESALNQLLPSSLRAFIIASSYWVLSLSLTSAKGSMAAFIGCLLACYLVDMFIQRAPLRDLRLGVIATMTIGLMVGGVSLSALLTSGLTLAHLLGPLATYELGEILQWFIFSAMLTTLLRSFAHRSGLGRVTEILFVATAFVITLAAHRQGMIHRPFFIGDFALSRGIDPSSILMAMGCGAVLALAGLLMMEQNHRRLPYHFTVLGLLCFSLLAYVQLFGLPTPRMTDDLGLTGVARTESGQQNENPFRDGENDASDKQAPVAVVLFRDDYEPEGGAYYFRESAYSQFNGTMLDFPNRSDLDEDLMPQFTPTRVDINEPPPALDKRQSVRTTIGLLAPHRNPFGLDTPIAYANTPNPNNLRFKQTYDAWSMVPQFSFPDLIGKQAGDSDWTPEQHQAYLDMPADPRYRELAETILQDLRPEFAADPYAKALAIKDYLDRNGIYSLKNEHAYAEDPAASFLFGDLTGYCMHFSFAATYMYRSIGIPARVGIGYSVPASNRAGGSALLIQAINGHAWPEIYLEGVGWTIVDPAPSRTLVDMSVDPQNSLQQLLGDMLRDEASFEEFIESQQGGSLPLAAALRLLAYLALALLLLAYAIKVYRLRIPYHANPALRYRLSYRATLDRLSALGLRRRYGESRENFARRLGAMSPSFTAMTYAHLMAALGRPEAQADGSSVDASQLAEPDWIDLNRRIRDEIRQHTPWWKQLLAFINPVAWLQTH